MWCILCFFVQYLCKLWVVFGTKGGRPRQTVILYGKPCIAYTKRELAGHCGRLIDKPPVR
ncbi:integrase domain-containing protein [Xenorhabdus sp. Vera]|nr:integrase domain-containing protein [Xenorhabdus sp. Vera]